MSTMFEDWKHILEGAKKESEKGRLICWSGVVYNFVHPGIRLDNAFLNLVYHEKGIPVFRRVPGRKVIEGNEPAVVFSTAPVYRITSGERKGHTVTLPEIRSNELYRLAGLEKKLEIGTDTDCFHPRRKGDRQVIELLGNLRTLKDVAVAAAIPRVWLTCSKDQTMLRVRSNDDARWLICNHPDFDSGLSLDKNVVKLRHHLQQPLNDGRVSYPFDAIYGRGVLAIDTKLFGKWFRIQDTGQKGYVRIA